MIGWTKEMVEAHNRKVAGEMMPEKRVSGVVGGRVQRESDLHDDIERHCREKGYLYIHSRMDRESTIQVGHPDWTIFMPDHKACFIECKKRGAKATTGQLSKIAHARKLGFVAEIVDNFEDAKSAMRKAREL